MNRSIKKRPVLLFLPIRCLFNLLLLSFRIMREFFNGFKTLLKYRQAVSFFGSATEKIDRKYYDGAEELAAALSKQGYAIATGGAGGIMRSANKGAYNAGGESIGLSIKLPHEQATNNYLTVSKNFNFFFSRKTMLSYVSQIYIFFPGGFGTLDELFNFLVLIQTNKLPKIKILLYGREFWLPWVHLIEQELINKHKTVEEKHRFIFTIVDSVDEALEHIKYARENNQIFNKMDRKNNPLHKDHVIYNLCRP